MLLRIVFFFTVFLIHFVTSSSNQEDLIISNYYQIGCVILKPDKEFIVNNLQENPLLPYQTFSSSNLTIDLCFRLCRRWIILMNSNHSNCICLYTTYELYEINEHIGDVLSTTNCTTNTLEIYSLTEDPYVLPLPTLNDDWSFEGCYYLHGIQTYTASFALKNETYIQAMDTCRKSCETIRSPTYFSFFLSLKKLCYCLPIKISPSITTTAIRKPLIHCSFLPYVKKGFQNSFNHSEIHLDTVVKINVQRYCSSSFSFDRNLYICFKRELLNAFNSYSKTATNEICSPVLVKTYEQWTHLLSLTSTLRSPISIWIDRNSTYIFDDLFKWKVSSLRSRNLCLVIKNRLPTSSYDLIPCVTVHAPGYILCTQRPLDSEQSEFKSIQTLPIVINMTCPKDFVLFNNICYYVDTNFVSNTRHGEQFCFKKYQNSTLVKFDSHHWGNVNTTRFLGRTLDDILLELFYYQLEKKSINETKSNTNSKHWLRLLIGDTTDNNKCVLRYFIRTSGGFTTLESCNQGGHPVCQCQPIFINEIKTQSSEIKIESTTTTEIPSLIMFNGTADEDLDNNETNIEYPGDQNNKTNIEYPVDQNNTTSIHSINAHSNHRTWLRYLPGPLLLALLGILSISIALLIVRTIARTSSLPETNRSLSTSPKETSNTPAVVYTRLKPSSEPINIETDNTHAYENSIINDDRVELLSPSSHHTNTDTAGNNEGEDHDYYAPL